MSRQRLAAIAGTTATFRRPTSMVRLVGRCLFVLVTGPMAVLMSGPISADPPRTSGSRERPTVTVQLASLNAAYADLKLLFDLIGDAKNQQILQETLEMSFEGVDPGRPCEIRGLTHPGGLEIVASLPVTSDTDFKKFLRALSDIDVKTAPSPERVPAAVRTKLNTLQLKPNERLIYSLYDGFLRYDGAYIQIGHELDAVRLPRAITAVTAGSPPATLTLRIDGDAATANERREAYRQSREKAVARLKKGEDDTDAAYAVHRAALDHLLAGLELVFTECSHAEIGWTMLHDQKQSQFTADVAPAGGTSLLADLQRVGQLEDAFAGVSRQDAVVTGSWNLPLPTSLGPSLKTLLQRGREHVRERLARATGLGDAQKAADREFADVLFDIMEDVASRPALNAFVRTWPNGDGTLTTVGAVRISEGPRHLAHLRQLKNQQPITLPASGSTLEILRIPLSIGRKDYRELFDADGAVLVGVRQDVLWWSLGEQALPRLLKTIEQADAKAAIRSDTAIELSLEMRTLSEVWNAIPARRPERPKKTISRTPRDKEAKGRRIDEENKPSVALLRSIIADLNLPKIAADAYRHGPSMIEITLKHEGEKGRLSMQVGEGTLRFIGQSLAKFTHENL